MWPVLVMSISLQNGTAAGKWGPTEKCVSLEVSNPPAVPESSLGDFQLAVWYRPTAHQGRS